MNFYSVVYLEHIYIEHIYSSSAMVKYEKVFETFSQTGCEV